MISNIMCRLSLFADYSNINYNNQNISDLRNAVNDIELYPNQLQTVDMMGNVGVGIYLSNSAKSFTLVVNSNRIDISFVSDSKGGFTGEQLSTMRTKMTAYVGKLYHNFGDVIQDANRLAWYTEYIWFDMDDCAKNAYRDRFLKDNSFYSDIITPEFAVQYAGRNSYDILEKKETFNILTNISRWFSPGLTKEIAIDGYKVGFDINTIQENKRNRFNGTNIESFLNVSAGIQEQLKESFLNESIEHL